LLEKEDLMWMLARGARYISVTFMVADGECRGAALLMADDGFWVFWGQTAGLQTSIFEVIQSRTVVPPH
jgi:hypothetical protein